LHGGHIIIIIIIIVAVAYSRGSGSLISVLMNRGDVV
jgi:hypothetical protein